MKIIKTIAILSLTVLFTSSCKNQTQTTENNKGEKNEISETMNTIKIKADMDIDVNQIFPRIKANYEHTIYKNDSNEKFLGNSNNKLDLPEKFTPITVELFEDIKLTFIANKGGNYQMLQQEVLLNGEVEPNNIYTNLAWSGLHLIL